MAKEFCTLTSCSTPSVKEIEDGIREAREILEKTTNRAPEVFVLTYSQFARLKKMIHIEPWSSFCGIGTPDSIYGINIEKHPSKKEVDERVAELRILGKTVGVIADD